MLKKPRKKIRSSQILVVSFIFIILLGGILLSMPFSTEGEPIEFIDAVFTSTSATCVTGLIVVDTGTQFTLAGQLIILLLIQIGGLGIMTMSTFFLFVIFGHISMLDREIIIETLTQKPIKNLVSLVRTTFTFVITSELVGAAFLTLRFQNEYPLTKAMYYGIFHSVSAFCNAGFSLFPDSFIGYSGDVVINVTLMALIVLGGIGFYVFLDLKGSMIHNRFNFLSHTSFYTKVVFFATFLLIVFGALIFFLSEHQNILLDMSLDKQIIVSLFQSVTARTAGFNTVDIPFLSNASLFFLIILMFIGASSGSCGGGIKTSTFTVLFAFLIAKFKNRQDVNLFQRRIPDENVSRAVSIAFFSIIVIASFTLLLLISEMGNLSHQESRGLFLELLFEVFSAFGTVGLSTGITPGLSDMGKILVSVLMLIGRLGPLTVAIAIGSQKRVKYRYPKENLLVG